jgi:hypothetical protein
MRLKKTPIPNTAPDQRSTLARRPEPATGETHTTAAITAASAIAGPREEIFLSYSEVRIGTTKKAAYQLRR